MSLSASVVSFERDSYYGGTGETIINPSTDSIDYGSRTVNGAAATDPASLNQQKAEALFGTSADGTGGGSYNFFGLTETTSYFLDAQFTYFLGNMGDWGKHNLVFGVQYEEEDIRDEQRNGDGDYLLTLHDDQFDNLGFFIQNEWEVNNKLEIVSGVRFDKTNTLDDWVVSPRIAARYKATDEITLRGNISTGFLAPRIFDEDIHIESIGGIPRDIVNSSDLEEERSLTYALGTSFTPKSMDGRLITSLQAYYTQLEDSFDLDEGSIRVENGREKIDRVNSDGSTIFGLEWDISYNFDEHWRVNGGLAYTRARYDEEDPDRGTDKYNKTPDFSGLAQLTYSNHNLFDAYVAVKWTGTMEVDRLDSVDPSAEATESSPDFFVIDVGISKWVEVGRTDVKLRAGISNLFDEYQDDLERGFERDPGYIYGPRYPGTLYVGATIEF